VISGGGGGGPLLAHLAQGSTNTNSFTSSPINTIGASLIVVGIAFYSGNTGTLTPSDNSSGANTFTQAVWDVVAAQFQVAQIHYCYNPPFTSASHTFTAGGNNAQYPLMFVMAFSGTTGTSVDKTNSAQATSNTSLQTGSTGTLSAANEIIIAMMSANGQPASDGAISVDSGLSQPDTSLGYNISTAGHYGGSMGWIQQAGTTALNPTFSWTPSSTSTVAVVATFK
jgi:flagellar hook-basal body complex protein FliE